MTTDFEEPKTAYALLDGEDAAREFQATSVEVNEREIVFRIDARDVGRFPRGSVLWWMG